MVRGEQKIRARGLQFWPTFGKGAALGVFASLALSGIFPIGYLGPPSLLYGRLMELVKGWPLLLLGGLVVFISTCLPCAMGGAMNAAVLYLRAHRRRLTLRAGILIGALHGLAWGSVALELALRMFEGLNPFGGTAELRSGLRIAYIVRDTPAGQLGSVGLFVGLIAIVSLLMGCFHGWRMTRYLQARSTDMPSL